MKKAKIEMKEKAHGCGASIFSQIGFNQIYTYFYFTRSCLKIQRIWRFSEKVIDPSF